MRRTRPTPFDKQKEFVRSLLTRELQPHHIIKKVSGFNYIIFEEVIVSLIKDNVVIANTQVAGCYTLWFYRLK